MSLIAIARERGGPRELNAQADQTERQGKNLRDPELTERIAGLRQNARELESEGVVSDNPATVPDEKLESVRLLEERAKQAQTRANQLQKEVERLKVQLRQ